MKSLHEQVYQWMMRGAYDSSESKKVENVTTDTVSLSWGASTDNIGVAGYHVYRDKQLVQEVQGEQFTDTGLTEDAEYTYEVRAFDAAGNQSEASNRINVRTEGNR